MKTIKLNVQKTSAFIVLWSVFCVGCQSTSKPQPQSLERPLQLQKSPDGLSNLDWKIVTIAGQKARFFQQQPYLRFNAATGRIQGNTGCNSLFGQYQRQAPDRLTLTANATHDSCDHALAQEADLMQSLMAVQRYHLHANNLNLLDAQGNILIVLQR